MVNRLGKVGGAAEYVPSVGTDDVSAGGFCHVLMWHGKARVTQEMESDFKLGTARAMPITVRSLLIDYFKNARKAG
jgi:hypothetical protein